MRRALRDGQRFGTVYPDIPWDPKESFQAVADCCAADAARGKADDTTG